MVEVSLRPASRREGKEACRVEEQAPFRTECIQAEQATTVIALAGEADVSSAPQFKEALLAAMEEGASTMVVDLSRVSFFDNAALGALVGGAKPARRKDGRLDIVCTDETMISIFQLSGLDRIFDIYRTRGEALCVLASTRAERPA
jgi:anti-sigma B factor antagonist